MHNPLLLLAPAVNVIVTGLFAVMLLRQYFARQRAHQLYWSIALCMAFAATLAYICMLLVQPTSIGGILLFRLYYILGGTVMPAWLGLGSVALVSSKRIARISCSSLSIASIVAGLLVLLANVDLSALRQVAGTPGTGILQPGAWLVGTILLNTLGVVAVVVVAAYSGWKLVRRQTDFAGLRTSNVLWANILILVGALLDASAGTFARFLGLESSFWLIMAVGWIVLFGGVVLAGSRSRRVAQVVAERESVQAIRS